MWIALGAVAYLSVGFSVSGIMYVLAKNNVSLYTNGNLTEDGKFVVVSTVFVWPAVSALLLASAIFKLIRIASERIGEWMIRVGK